MKKVLHFIFVFKNLILIVWNIISIVAKIVTQGDEVDASAMVQMGRSGSAGQIGLFIGGFTVYTILMGIYAYCQSVHHHEFGTFGYIRSIVLG